LVANPDVRDKQTYAIIGAAMEVHRRLGAGFLEAVYQEALAIEFVEDEIAFEREVDIPIIYRGVQLACTYRADFVCFGDIIVELKAIKQIGEVERAQTINYLKATEKKRGLLLNFGAASLQKERFAN
jgi:GxxExxY protein